MIQKIAEIRQMYRLLFPARPDPPASALVIWSNFDLTHVERGLRRAEAKWKFTTPPTDDILHRYVTGVAFNESQAAKEEQWN